MLSEEYSTDQQQQAQQLVTPRSERQPLRTATPELSLQSAAPRLRTDFR